MYTAIAPLLFRLDPERAHHLSLSIAGLASLPLLRPALVPLLRSCFRQPQPDLARTILGLRFKSPVCIAAGLDKDCEAVDALSALGIGALELGTVTPQPQDGNPKPRMFRFPGERALINRLGFPSCGVKAFKTRLERLNRSDVVIGVNIGKNKDTPIESCESDYEVCARELAPLADYLAINVSSPNTPGLRALQSPEMLQRVVAAVHSGNASKRPVLVKISPDCTVEQVREFVDCCVAAQVAGIIATNTTVWRPERFQSTETGGLSGAPLRPRADLVIQEVCRRACPAGLVVFGAGGVSNSSDVLSLIQLGCSAVQLYSSLVFEGPGLISRINRGLEKQSHLA